MNSLFKVPDWYDPEENIVRDLDWERVMFLKLGILSPEVKYGA